MSEAVVESLLGTAVGDALGLPYENLSPRRARKLLGPADRYRFLFRLGFVSDDTEHSCMVLQALIASNCDPDAFERELGRRLKWWFIKLPAGIGRATARACIKLWLGFHPSRCGVFSAGNGPAMRSAILGALIEDSDLLVELARRSARVTHSDPKAEFGAIAVALAAQHARTHAQVDPAAYLREVFGHLPASAEANEFRGLLEDVASSIADGETTSAYCERTYGPKGVSGYTYHTVPAAIHAWLASPKDFRQAVSETVECGGDADSTAAIVGGIVGAGLGRGAIPEEWLARLAEWPCTRSWMVRLATASSTPGSKPPRTPFVRQLLRNLVFLAVVLVHGFRRLLPPY